MEGRDGGVSLGSEMGPGGSTGGPSGIPGNAACGVIAAIMAMKVVREGFFSKFVVADMNFLRSNPFNGAGTIPPGIDGTRPSKDLFVRDAPATRSILKTTKENQRGPGYAA